MSRSSQFLCWLTAVILIVGVALFFPHAHHEHDHADEESPVAAAVGALELRRPRIVAPPPGAAVVAGYVLIANNGDAADTLLAAHGDFAETTEIHTMTVQDGVMRMRPLTDGLTLAAGDSTALAPHGNHLMFGGLTRAPTAGETAEVVLHFAVAGRVTVQFSVVGGADDDAEHRH